MGVGQLQPKRDPDIARSDCPVPHLGQRRRVPPVNVSSDSVRDVRSRAVLPANRAPPEASILRTWRCPCCNIRRERAGLFCCHAKHTPSLFSGTTAIRYLTYVEIATAVL